MTPHRGALAGGAVRICGPATLLPRRVTPLRAFEPVNGHVVGNAHREVRALLRCRGAGKPT